MLNAFRRSCVQDVLPALSLPAFLLLGILGIATVSAAHAQATSAGPTTPFGAARRSRWTRCGTRSIRGARCLM